MKLPQFILIAFLVVMNFIWSGASSVIKFYLVSIDGASLIFWRFAVALVALLIWVFAARVPLKIDKKSAARILAAGLLFGISNLLWVMGIDLSRASHASLLFVFEPIWGIILACIVLKEKIKAPVIFGFILVIIGLFVLSNFNFGAFGFENGAMALGNILITVSLMCEGTFSVVLKPASARVHPVLVMTLVLAAAELMMGALCAARGKLMLPSAGFLPAIIYLSIICTVIGYTLWVFVMKNVPVSAMFFTIFIQLLSGPFIAHLLLGEKIDSRLLTGGVILLAGMSVAVFGGIGRKTEKSCGLLPVAGEL